MLLYIRFLLYCDYWIPAWICHGKIVTVGLNPTLSVAEKNWRPLSVRFWLIPQRSLNVSGFSEMSWTEFAVCLESYVNSTIASSSVFILMEVRLDPLSPMIQRDCDVSNLVYKPLELKKKIGHVPRGTLLYENNVWIVMLLLLDSFICIQGGAAPPSLSLSSLSWPRSILRWVIEQEGKHKNRRTVKKCGFSSRPPCLCGISWFPVN